MLCIILVTCFVKWIKPKYLVLFNVCFRCFPEFRILKHTGKLCYNGMIHITTWCHMKDRWLDAFNCDLVMTYGVMDQHWFRQWLVATNHTWPNADWPSMGYSYGILLRTISQEMLNIYLLHINLTIANLKWQPRPQVVSRLIHAVIYPLSHHLPFITRDNEWESNAAPTPLTSVRTPQQIWAHSLTLYLAGMFSSFKMLNWC